MDIITDMHQVLLHRKGGPVGRPGSIVSLIEFLADLDMRPVYIVTGTPGKEFEENQGDHQERAGGR